MTRVVLHAGGRVVTVHPHNRSSVGLNVFLHRATTRDAEPLWAAGDKTVSVQKYRQMVSNASWIVQKHPVKVPRGAVAVVKSDGQVIQINIEGDVSGLVRDSAGALIGGGHRPEGVHARRTPITADAEYIARRVSGGWIVTRGDGKRLEIDEDCTEAEAVARARSTSIGWR